MLSTLSARALDQALTEVREEEELHALLSSRLRFERERDLTQAEVQRLQAEHERRLKEKERRFAAGARAPPRRTARAAAARGHGGGGARPGAGSCIEDAERGQAPRQGDPLEEEVAGPLPALAVPRGAGSRWRRRRGKPQRGGSAHRQGLHGWAEGGGTRWQEETRREAERKAAEEERLRVEREAEEERLRVIAEADAKKAAGAAAEAARIAAEAEAAEAAAAEDGDEDGERGLISSSALALRSSLYGRCHDRADSPAVVVLRDSRHDREVLQCGAVQCSCGAHSSASSLPWLKLK